MHIFGAQRLTCISHRRRKTEKSRSGEEARPPRAGRPSGQPVAHPSEHKSLAGDPGPEGGAKMRGGLWGCGSVFRFFGGVLWFG